MFAKQVAIALNILEASQENTVLLSRRVQLTLRYCSASSMVKNPEDDEIRNERVNSRLWLRAEASFRPVLGHLVSAVKEGASGFGVALDDP